MAVVKLHAEYLIPNLIWIAFAHLKFFFFSTILWTYSTYWHQWVSEKGRKYLMHEEKKENRKLFHHKRSILKRERETKSFLSSAHPFEWILLMPLARERINFVSCLSNWWRNGSSISPSTSLQQLSGVLREDDGCDGGGSVKKRKIVNAKLSNKSWTAVSERWEKVRRNPKCTCDWSAACWKKVLKFT